MSSTIEFTLSSPCPAHRDAILSWVIEGSESPSAAAAAEHVKRCVACREFRDSLKMQRVLVNNQHQVSYNRQGVHRQPRRSYADVVAKALDTRNDRDLAHSMWSCAQVLLRSDSQVSRRVHHE